jgi:hypothetical protein
MYVDESRTPVAPALVTDGLPPRPGDIPTPNWPQPSAEIQLPAPASADQVREDWAICCSGGGTYSATYCLGALQELDEGGLLARTRWILGASGGSFISASRALVAHDLAKRTDLAGGQAGTWPAGYDPACALRPYARGTPEEDNLRYNTRFIASHANNVLVGGLSLLGAMVTVIVALAPLYVLSHAWGWILRSQHVLTRTGPGLKMSVWVTSPAWWLVPVAAAAITIVLFLSWWRTFEAGVPVPGSWRQRWAGWSVVATAGLAVMMLVVPPLISWIYGTTGLVGSTVHFLAFMKNQNLPRAGLTGLVAAVVGVARAIKRELDKLDAPAESQKSGSSQDQPTGMIQGLASWVLHRLAPWLVSAVLVLVGAAAVLMWIAAAAARGFTLPQLVLVAVALAVMLLSRIAVDINRSSLHDLYRWRLADIYAVTRQAAEARWPYRRDLFAEAARTKLSDLRDTQSGMPDPHKGPQLVINATANMNANREAAPGRGGYGLAFDPYYVTLRSNPMSGDQEVRAATTDYEHLLGHTQFTLFDLMAISGATLSPRVCAMTGRSTYRLLLTLTNMRAGVWLPHPQVVNMARRYLESLDPHRQDRRWARWTWLLLLWYVSPHPFWNRDPDANTRRQARLWAHVLELRERSKEKRPGETSKEKLRRRRAGFRAAFWWRAMQPTLGVLWAEAAGHTCYRGTWIKVSDGAHHDTLGLVEALRRGANNIVVLAAGGDHPGTWSALRRAWALAKVDAGVEINLDPNVMVFPAGGSGCAPQLNSGELLRPFAWGTFKKLANAAYDGGELAGNIWVCTLGWWKGAPWSIQAYAAGHPGYLQETTRQQPSSSTEFEIYQSLGASAVLAAERDGNLPLPRSSKAAPVGVT